MTEIIVYGRYKPHCAYCEQAKKLLDIKKLPYTFVDINADGFDKVNLITVTAPGAGTIPIIFIDNIWIGGFDNLKSHPIITGIFND